MFIVSTTNTTRSTESTESIEQLIPKTCMIKYTKEIIQPFLLIISMLSIIIPEDVLCEKNQREKVELSMDTVVYSISKNYCLR